MIFLPLNGSFIFKCDDDDCDEEITIPATDEEHALRQVTAKHWSVGRGFDLCPVCKTEFKEKRK